MKLAIILVSHGCNAFGGIERATHFLARGLLANGSDVTIITEGSRRAYADPQIRTIGLQSLVLSYPATNDDIRAAVARSGRLLEREMVATLRTLSPDYVLIMDPIWGLLPLLERVWGSITCAIGLIFHVSHEPHVLEHLARLRIDHLYAVSVSLTRELRDASDSISRREVTTLPNSVCLADFRPRGSAECDAIMVHARISPEKGVDDAIVAFAQLRGHPSTELWLCAGDFPFGDRLAMQAEIQDMIADKGLTQRVKFLPNLPWSEIPDILQRARLVVVPSHKETFGMSALEALAAARPLVVTSAGNLPMLVGDAALVVPSRNPSRLADAMDTFLKNASLREAYAQRGIDRARVYDATVIASQLLDAAATRR